MAKVGEILAVTGRDIILCIKNHGGLGTPKRIGELVNAIKQAYPDLIIHYHGHNTDGNDIGRITEAILNGATIVDAADHAFTGFYGPPPVLTVIQTLKDYGKTAIGIDEEAVIETSDAIRDQRRYYAQFESQIKGFQPTVQIHKLPGGAMGSSLEQAAKGGFLDKMPDILHKELPRVQKDLGNYWSVTPGSQILWTTAVSNVLDGERYGNPSGDLKNLLLGKYGPFPFYRPADWIYKKAFGPDWKRIVEEEAGMPGVEDMDIEQERKALAAKLGCGTDGAAARPLPAASQRCGRFFQVRGELRPGLCPAAGHLLSRGAVRSGRAPDLQGPCRQGACHRDRSDPEDRTGRDQRLPQRRSRPAALSL